MSQNRFLLGLGAVVLAFVAVAAGRYDAASFGASHDDTLYFSAAKSIAEGRGYRMASVPGEPPQTKYPALYSTILSLAWKVEPEFPSNLKLAWAINVLFGALAVAAAGALARQLGAGPRESLALAALTALHPFFIYWTNQLVSDLAFTSMALGSVVLAERELRRPGGGRWAAWAGVVALLSLACATRTVGVAFVAGVSVAALWRGERLAGAAALAGAAPAVWGLLARGGKAALPETAKPLPGFEQNYLYYASYVAHWKQSVPSWDVLGAQVQMAFTETLKHPAVAVFHLPAAGFASMPVSLIAIAVSIGVTFGIVSRARKSGLHPIHVAALSYLPIVLLWNYLIMERFWLPFLPLFLAGASHELLKIAGMARESWRKSPAADRAVVAAFGAALVLLVSFAAYRGLWQTPAALARTVKARGRLAGPKLEAYRWLREHSSAADAVISYDDAALYLYSGRQGMRALSPLTDSFFAQDESRLERDLDGIADTAAALGARYWLTAPDDFEMTHAPERMRRRLEETLAVAPVVFASADGRVRIHDVSQTPWRRPGETALRSGDAGLK